MESATFRLLGPVELWYDGGCVELGHAKQRCVLVALLLETGQVVPAATLIDRVWGHGPPNAALNVVYGYVTRLRKALVRTDVRVSRRYGGYLLETDPASVDVHRFRQLLARAGVLLAGRDAERHVDQARKDLDAALALWHGTPFTGIAGQWISAKRAALEDQHLSAIIERNEFWLRDCRYAELVGQLLDLVTTHPLDERVVGQLMRAMHGAGRPSDALEQYRTAQQRLRKEQGNDPAPALRELQRRILRDDPTGSLPSMRHALVTS